MPPNQNLCGYIEFWKAFGMKIKEYYIGQADSTLPLILQSDILKDQGYVYITVHHLRTDSNEANDASWLKLLKNEPDWSTCV